MLRNEASNRDMLSGESIAANRSFAIAQDDKLKIPIPIDIVYKAAQVLSLKPP